MSNTIQAGSVHGLTKSITISTAVLESLRLQGLLDLNFSNAATVPLTRYTIPYFIRQDRKDKQRLINVFNGGGEQVYTFERLSSLNPVWRMLTFPQREEVATIMIGLTSRSVDFHNKEELCHRDIFLDWGKSGKYRSFYLNDGYKYSWSTSTKYLEWVVNPGCGPEEKRIRIAKARLMRQFKVDFEISVDEENIDPEIVLATALISIFTQWGTGSFTDTNGPTCPSPEPEHPITRPGPSPGPGDGPINRDPPITLVIENGGDETNLEVFTN
ncbi:uncharacterized protein J8A68_001123 [[Candida] subhashii]|uniref:Uncharacterized protein n=1 Tax=[Candida] subhashii TaxID=561895 RepID=A0A8J5V0G1_9ASCO|nr:uncharacterized protein J8A68_001123 [[Candida] subhashii]KAG7665435.1 hypothetical protein J8A68_001123 [[Candida] subhashii]